MQSDNGLLPVLRHTLGELETTSLADTVLCVDSDHFDVPHGLDRIFDLGLVGLLVNFKGLCVARFRKVSRLLGDDRTNQDLVWSQVQTLWFRLGLFWSRHNLFPNLAKANVACVKIRGSHFGKWEPRIVMPDAGKYNLLEADFPKCPGEFSAFLT